MRRLALLLLLAAVSIGRSQQPAAPATAPATDAVTAPEPPPDPAKAEEIRKLIENTGVKENMKVVMSRMFEMYRKKFSQVPADFWTQVESDQNLDDLISRLTPIYARYYTIDDIKAINAFYESPTGQHMKEIQPQILGASMLVGQQWGREMGAKIMSGIQAQQAKQYATEGKNTYYTSVSTNAAPAATAPITNAPAVAH